MPQPPRSTALIVSWNTRELTLRALESLRRHAPGCPVVVVDNASADGSAEAIRAAFPEVLLLEPGRNLGFAAGINLGMREVCTELAWWFNPDAEAKAGALEALEAALLAQPRWAAVGPALHYPDGRFQAAAFRFPSPWGSSLEALRLPRALARWRDRLPELQPIRTAGEADWLLGAAMLVRMEAWRALGPLDEAFFVYGEELDWAWRARAQGWAMGHVPDAQVMHVGQAGATQVSLRARAWVLEGRARCFARHRPGLGASCYPSLCALAAAWNATWQALRPSPGGRLEGPLEAWRAARQGLREPKAGPA